MNTLNLRDPYPAHEIFPDKWTKDDTKDDPIVSLTKEQGFNFTEEQMTKFNIWPLGVIPYFVDDFSYEKSVRDNLKKYFEVVNMHSGLFFLELPRPPNDEQIRWVFFINRRGQLNCADYTTKSFTHQGVQKVILGYDCMKTGGIGDVVLALAGVPPQHNAPNRNKYISVIEENILPEKQHLFKVLKDDEWLFQNMEYDFLSAGHYPWHKYTANGKATIIPKNPVYHLVGEPLRTPTGLSYMDIWKIRMLYNSISRMRSYDVSVPECYKYFKPGTNFNKYRHVSEEKIEPRKKPNQDIPDESSEKLNEENKEENEESQEDNINSKLTNKTLSSQSREEQSISEQNTNSKVISKNLSPQSNGDENDSEQNSYSKVTNKKLLLQSMKEEKSVEQYTNLKLSQSKSGSSSETNIDSDRITNDEDHDKNIIRQVLNGRGPSTTFKDPLTYLSDYKTDN